MILIVGASGFLGREVAKLLLSRLVATVHTGVAFCSAITEEEVVI